VQPSVPRELHGTLGELLVMAEGTESVPTRLPMTAQRQWPTAARVAAPCVHNKRKVGLTG
jgi:hypothetical protein